MPKNKFQEVIFTIIMVFVMVYAMICYNIVLNTGTMTNETFLLAFHELTFMGPIAFILDFFIIGGLAKKIAFGIVDMRRDNPFHLVLAISAVSVAFMCPCMSFCGNCADQTCTGKSDHSHMAPDNSNELSDGILLADFLCRTIRKIYFRKAFPGERKGSSFCRIKNM